MESIISKRVCIFGLALLLTGCSGMAALSAVSALSSAPSGVSASLQVGDKATEVAKGATVGTSTEAKVVSKVGPIAAQREVKVDQSTQKKDQKTEIGEVKGDVKVIQGPTGSTMGFLYIGWILAIGMPLGTLLWLYKRH
jgi:hypothetical protein